MEVMGGEEEEAKAASARAAAGAVGDWAEAGQRAEAREGAVWLGARAVVREEGRGEGAVTAVEAVRVAGLVGVGEGRAEAAETAVEAVTAAGSVDVGEKVDTEVREGERAGVETTVARRATAKEVAEEAAQVAWAEAEAPAGSVEAWAAVASGVAAAAAWDAETAVRGSDPAPGPQPASQLRRRRSQWSPGRCFATPRTPSTSESRRHLRIAPTSPPRRLVRPPRRLGRPSPYRGGLLLASLPLDFVRKRDFRLFT